MTKTKQTFIAPPEAFGCFSVAELIVAQLVLLSRVLATSCLKHREKKKIFLNATSLCSRSSTFGFYKADVESQLREVLNG